MLFSRVAGAAILVAGATLSIAGVANAQGDRNCSDFSSQAEAQQFFENTQGDPHGLDADNDGIACEELPGPSDVVDAPGPVQQTPVGGIDTGDGSTVDDSDNLTLLLGLAGLGAASATTVVVVRRARRTS